MQAIIISLTFMQYGYWWIADVVTPPSLLHTVLFHVLNLCVH